MGRAWHARACTKCAKIKKIQNLCNVLSYCSHFMRVQPGQSVSQLVSQSISYLMRGSIHVSLVSFYVRFEVEKIKILEWEKKNILWLLWILFLCVFVFVWHAFFSYFAHDATYIKHFTVLVFIGIFIFMVYFHYFFFLFLFDIYLYLKISTTYFCWHWVLRPHTMWLVSK